MILFPVSGAGRRSVLPFLLFALAAAGCGGDATSNPTAPSPFEPLGTYRTVEITASLTTPEGSCTEATILYDGRELPDARSRCTEAKGCSQLDLGAVVRTDEGTHTIALQVLGQQPDGAEYVAQARVRVSRDGFPGTVTLDLGPTRVFLRSGEAVSFDVLFRNSWS